MRALVLNCTLKPSPEESNTDALLLVVLAALREHDDETETIRVVDPDVRPGVESDVGEADGWPAIRSQILARALAERPGRSAALIRKV